MKPTIESWISPTNNNCGTTYHATISADTYRLCIGSDTPVISDWPYAVHLSIGPMNIDVTAEVARALAQQLTAAANHYDSQVAAAQEARVIGAPKAGAE